MSPVKRHSVSSKRNRALLVLGVLLPMAFVLLIRLHHEGLCQTDDWPSSHVCASAAENLTQRKQALFERAAQNPGDSRAWVNYAVTVRQLREKGVAVDEAHANSLLPMLEWTAPTEPRSLRLRAAQAVQSQDWNRSAQLLLSLIRDHRDGQAARVLARLMPKPEVQAYLQQAARSDARWLGSLMDGLVAEQMPLRLASALVWVAVDSERLPTAHKTKLIEDYKRQGQWLDAYALWVKLQGGPVEPVNNGTFDRDIDGASFDWVVPALTPSRSGLRYTRSSEAQGNHHMQLHFLGRAIPEVLLSQEVFAQPGRLQLEGRWKSAEFKAEEGLVWSMVCAKDEQQLAQSEPLHATQGEWRAFKLTFQVSPSCGPVIRLVLRTAGRYDALRGIRGDWAVDDIRLSIAP